MKLYINYTPIDSGFLSINNTGLGNLLFQLAFQYVICQKYSLQFNSYFLSKYIDKLKTHHGFNYKETIFRNINYDYNDLELIDIEIKETLQSIFYDPNIINIIETNIDLNKNILITDSYLQSIKYIKEYETDIQELLSPDEKSLNLIYSKYPVFLNNNIIKISIHIRYNWGAGISYSGDYLKYCIEYFDKLYDNIVYIIVSDNIDIVKNNYHDDRFIYCEGNNDYIDIWIISLCNHNIICHSTFGWWGSFLNKSKNKIVLYPTDIISYFYINFFKFSDDYYLIKKNIFPDNWVGIDINSMIKI